jgi:hypothetical protein
VRREMGGGGGFGAASSERRLGFERLEGTMTRQQMARCARAWCVVCVLACFGQGAMKGGCVPETPIFARSSAAASTAAVSAAAAASSSGAAADSTSTSAAASTSCTSRQQLQCNSSSRPT